MGLAIGSRLSGLLATLVMDDLEHSVLTADLSISIYTRYVDDIFILTSDHNMGSLITEKFNQAHPTIKFEEERPMNNTISLLDFTITCLLYTSPSPRDS